MRFTNRTVRNLLRATASVSSLVFRNHCQSTVTNLGKMRIKSVPALGDNYMYLLIDDQTNSCAIVDPVEPDDALTAVKEEKVDLVCGMTTHHHWDHAGGNEKLVAKVGWKLPMYGGDQRIKALTNLVKHNDEFKVGSLTVKCLFTPCHTSGHICYYIEEAGSDPVVFTGDTLFTGGCGRFFEGNANDMYRALIKILSELPSNTRVFCGHEYTIRNLEYAQHVEKDNSYITQKLNWAKEKRAKNLPTVPSTIEEEKKMNPFMRVGEKDVQKHVGSDDEIKVMELLRKEKDNFKGK